MIVTTARPVEHTYRDGYGRRHLDCPFFIVECAVCRSALNSGHHYRPDELHLAQQLADEHNAELHHVGTPEDERVEIEAAA